MFSSLEEDPADRWQRLRAIRLTAAGFMLISGVLNATAASGRDQIRHQMAAWFQIPGAVVWLRSAFMRPRRQIETLATLANDAESSV